MYQKTIHTPIGKLNLYANKKGLYKCCVATQTLETKENQYIIQAEKELKEYFLKQRKEFEVPLDIQGTTFQKQVYNALRNIAYGETRSYKQIAIEINNPKAVRAIGLTNHRNPLLLFVPCHRVIAHNGDIGGFALGVEIKQELLALEKPNK